MRKMLALVCLLCIVPVAGCNKKVDTDPSALARFNSISARLDRIATVYAPAALRAVPSIAPIRKWSEEQVKSAETVIGKMRDSAASGRRTLGNILDSAISADQRVILGPLLVAIGDGIAELENLGLFASLGNSKIEAGIRVAAEALKAVGRLLPREEALVTR